MKSERIIYQINKDNLNFKIVLDLNDKDVSKQILEYGWYQDEAITCEIFKKYLKKGMTVLDLGANIGFYTLLARRLVGSRGKVFAFEPSPDNARLIKNSIQENKFDNVIIVKAAVSDRFGRARFYLAPDYISEHTLISPTKSYSAYSRGTTDHKIVKVETISIDGYLQNYFGKNDFRVDFIKMDIEGWEIRALEGMKKTIEKNKKIILVSEFWPNGFYHHNKTPNQFLKRLLEFGFKINHIDELEKRIYSVNINEMLKIADFRTKNKIEKNKEDWYTNLLCIK